jgi:hypothetical protein
MNNKSKMKKKKKKICFEEYNGTVECASLFAAIVDTGITACLEQ